MISSLIVPILLVSGAATAGSFVLALAPRSMARVLFGRSEVDALTLFLIRYVGVLVGLIGCLTMYSAYHPDVRPPVLVAAILEKVVFVGLVIAGGVKRTTLLIAAAIADASFALLYLVYLAGA